jgi:hypothetical protein
MVVLSSFGTGGGDDDSCPMAISVETSMAAAIITIRNI